MVDSPAGLFEFSDTTMIDGNHPFLSRIDGADVSEYLDRYARTHNLDNRIRLKTKVVNVLGEGEGWQVASHTGENLFCDKLIVSTGLASQAKQPDIPNIDNGFAGPTLHTYFLGKDHHRLTDPAVKQVVVIGGSKSAIETVCLCIYAGKFVNWTIRADRGGASMMTVTDKDKAHIIAVNATRIFNVFSPAIFAASGFWYKFLHSGKSCIGGKIEDFYWRSASKIVNNGPKYEKSTNGDRVRPIIGSVFWKPNCISLMDKKSSFLEHLHDHTKLSVRRDIVTRLSNAGVHLAIGETINADAIVYATGWEKSSSFFDKETTIELGLPIEMSDEPALGAEAWAKLHQQAGMKVKATLPELQHPPNLNLLQATKTPYRLYRNIIPPKLAAKGDRSIALTGLLVTAQTVIFSEISSLYAVAYMEGLLP